jgi:hypothetical protein
VFRQCGRMNTCAGSPPRSTFEVRTGRCIVGVFFQRACCTAGDYCGAHTLAGGHPRAAPASALPTRPSPGSTPGARGLSAPPRCSSGTS